MAAAASSFRPPHSDGTCEGSDQETGGSFATSRVEGQRETVTPGAATGPHHAHCLPLDGGGELRICAVHGRLEVLARLGKGRVFQTTPLSAERGDTLARRISEIADIARAQRQAKGA